jgi:hypothetical protein
MKSRKIPAAQPTRVILKKITEERIKQGVYLDPRVDREKQGDQMGLEKKSPKM